MIYSTNRLYHIEKHKIAKDKDKDKIPEQLEINRFSITENRK